MRRAKLDIRELFEYSRVNIKEFQTILNNALRRGVLVNIFEEDYRELRNAEKTDYKITGWQYALSVLNDELALFTVGQSGLVCYWTYLDDYTETKMYDYESRTFNDTTGAEAYRIMCRYQKLPIINEYKKAPLSAYQLLYKSEKYTNKRIKNAVCYDRNSSFPSEIKNNFINFNDLGRGRVEEGMIGFNEPAGIDVPFLPITTGNYADHRFMLEKVPEGLKRFADNWYDKKKNAKNQKERNRAKKIMNSAIGSFQNKNWAYRALIIAKSNEYIYNWIKALNEKYGECVIYANTDSICVDMDVIKGKCELEDLVGKEIGQFKVEHRGSLYVSDTAYQWDGELPTWSGPTKRKFVKFKELYGRDFNLETDANLVRKISKLKTNFVFDKDKMEIVVR